MEGSKFRTNNKLKTKNMIQRRKIYEVPEKGIKNFIVKMTSLDLINTIIGLNRESEIVIEVTFERSEAASVDELYEFLDDMKDRFSKEK
jgi:hypothetical protein